MGLNVPDVQEYGSLCVDSLAWRLRRAWGCLASGLGKKLCFMQIFIKKELVPEVYQKAVCVECPGLSCNSYTRGVQTEYRVPQHAPIHASNPSDLPRDIRC
eukprot:365626-Chlamydomonas_euryale.AAC.8